MILLILFLMLQTGQSNIEIKNAWIRPGAAGMNTALYFDIQNKSKSTDTLYDARSSLAQVVEIHETFSKGDMMGMRRTMGIPVNGNSTFQLKPGGHHVMFIKLNKKLEPGTKGQVSLFFKKAGEVKIEALVKK